MTSKAHVNFAKSDPLRRSLELFHGLSILYLRFGALMPKSFVQRDGWIRSVRAITVSLLSDYYILDCSLEY